MLIDEHIAADSRVMRTFLGPGTAPPAQGGVCVRLRCDSGIHGELALAALDIVMRRYGKPLDPDIAVTGPRVELGAGTWLTVLSFRAAVDAAARDYLVWSTAGSEPVAALSGSVSAALRHLVASRA